MQLDLSRHWHVYGIPEPVPEFRFCPGRRWRADYGWPAHKLLVELEGGVFVRGRHVRGYGYLGDMAKYNAAVLLGYSILRYTPRQFRNGEAAEGIKAWFGQHNNQRRASHDDDGEVPQGA